MSRPGIFTVFNLNKVNLPLVDIELVESANISAGFNPASCLGCDTWCKLGVVGEFFSR